MAYSYAGSLTSFIDQSPTPFHVVSYMEGSLKDRDFESLEEGDLWALRAGGKGIVTRNDSTLAAFIIGSKPVAESGFRIIAVHTDSPNLRLKPKAVHDKLGYAQLAVEPYGGLILASWLNRDLSIAGRVVVRRSNGSYYSKLIKVERPVLSIPQLAIHLDRDVNEKGLVLNKQTHLSPIFALLKNGEDSAASLLNLLKYELRYVFIEGDEIVESDLSLYDTQGSSISGLNHEFIYAPRLDNLSSCHAAFSALKETHNPESTCIVVCYDNEEVGSQTAQGAASPFLKDLLHRILNSISVAKWISTFGAQSYNRAVANSFCISADVAHAVHPNYADRHDSNHMPVIGKGPVIKSNANQRYASDGVSMAFFKELCRLAEVPYQNFVNRSDLACGSTIGPITAAEIGIRTVDVGNPILSMHSAREQAGVADHVAMIEVMKKFFSATNLKI